MAKDSMAARFAPSCRHCGQSIMVLARIGDRELGELRDHVRACRPHELRDEVFRVETALRHFRLTLADSSSKYGL